MLTRSSGYAINNTIRERDFLQNVKITKITEDITENRITVCIEKHMLTVSVAECQVFFCSSEANSSQPHRYDRLSIWLTSCWSIIILHNLFDFHKSYTTEMKGHNRDHRSYFI